MKDNIIKKSLDRLLEYRRITQEQYNTALDKLANPQPPQITEQDVVDSIVEEVRK